MAYELYLRHFDRAGILKRAVINPLWARYTDEVNGQGPLVFALPADAVAAQALQEFDILQVMLRNRELGLLDFTPAYTAILRVVDLWADADGVQYLQYTAPGEQSILGWRHVLWYANLNNRSSFSNVPAETIMKTVVDYNLTALAAHAPSDTTTRQRDGDLGPGMGITVTTATDQGRGNNLSQAFSGANVLTVLRRLAERGGGDFALAWQGNADWEFEFYPGQRGEDKSSGADRVLFSLENNTMLVPRLETRGADATAAISAGQGEDQAREVDEVLGPDYAADYDIETFVDARGEVTQAGRVLRGGLRLDEMRRRRKLSFGVRQTADQYYSPVPVTGRKTYRAGDIVAAAFGEEQRQKLDWVRVDWRVPGSGDAFTVSVGTHEVPDA